MQGNRDIVSRYRLLLRFFQKIAAGILPDGIIGGEHRLETAPQTLVDAQHKSISVLCLLPCIQIDAGMPQMYQRLAAVEGSALKILKWQIEGIRSGR